MMRRLLPNPHRFAKAYILKVVERNVVLMCDGLGEQRLAWCIQQGRSLGGLVPQETEAQYRERAPAYGWAAQAITDEEFRHLLPEWVKALVARHGDAGETWLRDTILWIRGFFQ